MDELIHVPGEEDGGPVAMGPGVRKISLALLLLGALVILGTTAMDTLFPAPVVKPIGQEARDLMQAKLQQNPWDGSLASGWETHLKARSRVRRSLAPFWSAFVMKVLNTVPADLVAGQDGWLFLRDRIQPPAATRDRGIRLMGQTGAAIQRRLARMGSAVTFIPVPRKAVACAEKLPRGMKSDPEYDAGIVQALRERGVTLLDVTRAWEDVPAEGRYLRRDTHWAFGGEKALARSIAETYPELVTHETKLWLQEAPTAAPALLLDFAAIQRDHPAVDWINGDVSIRPYLRPREVLKRMKKLPTDVDVAVVGSSFTRNFAFAELVAVALGRVVYPGGIAGTPFGGSLAYFAGKFSGRRFPSRVLYEFPIHQAFQIGAGSHSAQQSLAAFFTGTTEAGTLPLPVDLLGPFTFAEKPRRGGKVLFPEGTLLSSGDGVLQLRIKTWGDDSTEWQLRSTGALQYWVLGPGEHEVLLPVIQSLPDGSEVGIVAAQGAAPTATVTVTVEVDADLEHAVEIPLEPSGDHGLQGASEAVSVGLHDVVTIQWTGSPEEIDVLIRGVTPDGVEREVRATFREPVSKICVLSLTPFEAGEITAVEVQGAIGEVRAFLAPQLSD
ncbi:hypothetical protein Poly30_40780 [Planctomycetes bacterium Poly30]|uniref:AlgX/AlgJ SGNH hydrolase-like domain-containing protein n=1 Tax=Saltatorellus ferox TaxID=2528018 RepID=A0A518EWS2_9BACT|nr:hypothetical protein Poly30_40780 [Planctomycetes bacterium Poly30]